jgi:serine/threonine-protein kinase HipA
VYAAARTWTVTSSAQQCFVYITLPGATEPVTAARFELQLGRTGTPVGRFVYGRSYLDRSDAVEFDPVELRLSPQRHETVALGGIFGALRDAGPDYWGRRIIEKHAGKAQLSELDYLLQSADDRAGALGFGLQREPPAPRRKFNQTLDLETLQTIADAVVADEALPPDEASAQIQDLLLLGTSMGGARPKTIVEDDDGLWIAKFNRRDDRWNNARVEHAMLVLARQCGIHVADSRVEKIGDRDVLLVRRFDRERAEAGYARARMISALTLLRTGDGSTEDGRRSRERWSYVLLAEELRRASAAPEKDAAELFRRMCFNALISNTDDHPRNHALLARDRRWRLSPAYDLTPSTPISIERRDLALIIGDHGRAATAANLLSQSRRFLLEPDRAAAIIDDMEQQVRSSWYGVARAEGVSARDCERVEGAFAYPGFRLRADRSPAA